MIIYKITNKVNGKIYIGQTIKTLNERFKGHIITAEKNRGFYVHHAIMKYGKENFMIEQIEKCISLKELGEREIYWIGKLDSTNKKIGYNITKGGEFGDTFTNNPNKEVIREKHRINSTNPSKETREKMRKAKLGHKFNLGRKMPPNRKGIKNKKSGLPIGVYKYGEKYRAEIRYRGHHYSLGMFTLVEDAAAAYLKKKKEYNEDFIKNKNNLSNEVRQEDRRNFPWNKGLTKETNNVLKEQSETISKSIKKLWIDGKYKNRNN